MSRSGPGRRRYRELDGGGTDKSSHHRAAEMMTRSYPVPRTSEGHRIYSPLASVCIASNSARQSIYFVHSFDRILVVCF